MASLHIIYDPKSKITGLAPDQLKVIGASAIVMSVLDDLDENTIDSFVGDAIIRLLDQAGIPK